jgi:hypothetical protein
VLRRISGLNRDEMVGWRKLHNEELNDFYSLPNIILMIKARRMRLACHVAHLERRGVCKGFLLERLKEEITRWNDNIKMDLREVGWVDMSWINLAEDSDQWMSLVNMVMNLWVP